MQTIHNCVFLYVSINGRLKEGTLEMTAIAITYVFNRIWAQDISLLIGNKVFMKLIKKAMFLVSQTNVHRQRITTH